MLLIRHKIFAPAFWAGGIALLSGVGYYVLCRQPKTVLFLDALGMEPHSYNIYFIPWFPSFIHVMSFSLLTSSVVWQKKEYVNTVCVSWVLINTAFECAQLPLLELGWRGTFDVNDIIASFGGGICAMIVLFIMRRVKT